MVCCAPFVAPVVALEAFRPGQMRLDADRASLEASKSLDAVLGIFVSVGGSRNSRRIARGDQHPQFIHLFENFEGAILTYPEEMRQPNLSQSLRNSELVTKKVHIFVTFGKKWEK